MKKARNILVLHSDEMRGDAPGFTGNPDCRTPHLDALARAGTVCSRHYTVHGKCVPSRIAMMTGRYAHTDGIRTVNETNLLPKGLPNLAEHLRDRHGYETAVFGLNHVWEGLYEAKGKGASQVDYHSFSTPELDELAHRKIPVSNGEAAQPDIPELDVVEPWGRKRDVVEGFNDVNRADQGVTYLKELRDREKPFYLQINLSKPHPSYRIHEPWYSMYGRAALTPYPHELPANATLHLRKQRELRLGNDISERALRELQAIYYGSISYVDDCFARVLQALDDEGLRDDTLIIFTSDHGDFAGQYGINEKWDTAAQECILHVPFVLSGPGIEAGATFDGLSEHVDFPATILDYLGLAGDEQWVQHGRSLLPALAGGPRKEAIFADGGHEAPMRARMNTAPYHERDGRRYKATGGKQLVYHDCPDTMARMKMVRTQEWKLVMRETGGNELFHLASDPHEMKNLYGEPAHNAVVLDLQRRLIEWCLRTDTDRPFQERVGA